MRNRRLIKQLRKIRLYTKDKEDERAITQTIAMLRDYNKTRLEILGGLALWIITIVYVFILSKFC